MVNSFTLKSLVNIKLNDFGREEPHAGNSTLAIGGGSSPLDSFVVAESSVLRTNSCAEKPAHRQSANRCASYPKKTTNDK